jgi:hypothetical protein
MKAPASKPVHTISVRGLVEFVLRSGDLGGEREFVGSDRALAGIRGHQKIQRSRPSGYLTELPVEYRVETEEFTLQIRGRIDGLLITSQQVLLEEIKTVQGKWNHEADLLHWAQAKFYAFMHAQENGLKELVLQLVYLELPAGKVTEFRQTVSFTELSDFFAATTAVYVEWLRERHHWCLARDASIAALAFPFPEYRPGQRDLAVAAYRVMANGGRLFLAAPTGIGKTISVLFPAVKALGEGQLERIFYLTARTVGRAIAEKALVDLRRAGLKLRAVTLTAKENVCVRGGHPCDPLTCPLALGYYDPSNPQSAKPWNGKKSPALFSKPSARNIRCVPSNFHWMCPSGPMPSSAITITFLIRRFICVGTLPRTAAHTPSSSMKRTTWWIARGRCSPPIWMAKRFWTSSAPSNEEHRVAPRHSRSCTRQCRNWAARRNRTKNHLKSPIPPSNSICFRRRPQQSEMKQTV